MGNQITSQVIGQLTQDDTYEDWWKSKEITIPLFNNQKLPITFMNWTPDDFQAHLEEADTALRNFLHLTIDDLNNVTDLVYKNYTDFMDEVIYDGIDPEMANMTQNSDIWKFVYPTDIYISKRHRRDKDIYISVACSCGWDDEHGLQLVFRQGKKVTRVSGEDGHLTEADAWNKPDEEDELLSKF
ncbi:hypothetical protein SAMN05518672_103697 [Chitinophaga sp. CF118]|uniref:DUF6985 domain-containing protein n=1 Tax=Chitinophaga sp. CF118 TaxID=1884367 RepID=UPI0008E02273|nr:hypothetical protein [Chitinophaga sp. CF118]SFD88584.1 hypothetical protein SAMN05518672_103697 [Chitinophaga sp. CF118]